MQRSGRWSRRAAGALAVVACVLVSFHGAAASATVSTRVLLPAPRVALSVLPQKSHRQQVARPRSYSAGTGITVRAGNLPRPARTFCVGLASLIDRGGLPINLGRLHATGQRTGELQTRIPAGLIGPEPPGPYLVFVGDCATPAPMGNYGSITITIPR